ncbi:MAG: UDP-N-acetylmuramate dehydrogenase [Coprobacillaceae bacterium]
MDFTTIKEELEVMNIGDIIEDEPMYKHTTYKVGGPAKLYIKVNSIDALRSVLEYCKEKTIQHMIIGKGSNLLFSDKLYEGIIISLNEYFNNFHINGSIITCDAGVSMISLAYEAAKTGLSGLEFMGGIPGTVGGGVYMNAGAYKSNISNVIESVTILDENLEIKVLNKEEMKFSYRHSILQKNKNWIVLSVTFTLTTGNPKEIKEVLDDRKERRMSSQPWNLPSAGSIFRNPEDKAAWQYIDDAGMRGYEIGGAQVSPKHSNFIVNNGYASAKDIYELIIFIKQQVKEKFGVELKQEVCFVNWE